jgi:DMSO/TMAO reductase YedYZ heme-binding membrane subunit
MNGITATTAPWFASRATGVVALLLLTGVMVLGVLVNRQGRLPGMPRFAVTGLHRNLSLLAVAFTAIHVITAVIDTFVSIPLVSAVIPFTSGYEGFWLGLGAISSDIMLALIITSLLRRHLSRGVWRAVHWLAYVSWPVAFFHSIYSSKDLQRGPLLIFAILCALAVVAAVVWRLAAAAREVPRAQRVRALMSGSAGRTDAGRPEARPPGAGRPKAGRPADSRKSTAVS